jgi:hypothetical protein
MGQHLRPFYCLIRYVLYSHLRQEYIQRTTFETILLLNNIVLLWDVFHIGLVIGSRPAVLA